jgi:hypothetical protein
MRLIVYLVFLSTSLALIWKYGYAGFAFARLINDIIFFIAALFYINKMVYKLQVLRIGFLPTVSCIFCLLLFYFLADFNVWLTVPTILIVYAVGVFVFKGVQWHDFVFLKEILFGKKNEISKL